MGYFKLGYGFVQKSRQLHFIYGLYKSKCPFESIILFTLVAENQQSAEPRPVNIITLSQPFRVHPCSTGKTAFSLLGRRDIWKLSLAFVLTSFWYYLRWRKFRLSVMLCAFISKGNLNLTSENFKLVIQRNKQLRCPSIHSEEWRWKCVTAVRWDTCRGDSKLQKNNSGYFVCKQLKASEVYRAVQKSYNNKY